MNNTTPLKQFEYTQKGVETAKAAIEKMKATQGNAQKREVLHDSFKAMAQDQSVSKDERSLASLAVEINKGDLLPKEGANALHVMTSAIAFSIPGPVGNVIAAVSYKSAKSTFVSLSKTGILNSGFKELVANPRVSGNKKEMAEKGLMIKPGVPYTGVEGENPPVMNDLDVAYFKLRMMDWIKKDK